VRWARVIAKVVRRLFMAAPMPNLAEPVADATMPNIISLRAAP
jgi:hypothetical protein